MKASKLATDIVVRGFHDYKLHLQPPKRPGPPAALEKEYPMVMWNHSKTTNDNGVTDLSSDVGGMSREQRTHQANIEIAKPVQHNQMILLSVPTSRSIDS